MPAFDDRIDVFLQPGDLFVGDAGYRIRTMLGSCVSITLWHPASRLGGMSHFLLPTRGGPPAKNEFDGRYGDEALALMLAEFRQAGIPPAACQAKIFGGGNMFPGQVRDSDRVVGQRNGQAAQELLAAQGIPVISKSLYGVGHRQVIFDIASGHVWSNQIPPTAPDNESERRPT